jgi:poly(3-hydroxybutyrate) depolymerase
MRRSLLVLAALPLILTAPTTAEDRYGPGRSTHEMDGIRYELLVPSNEQAKDGYALLVILHGSGGTATGMVGTGQPLMDLGFVTCAPKSTGPRSWSAPDLEVVRKIASHLIEMYGVEPHRRHAAGFSNGGWHLAPVAFDEKLRFRTATWIAAGFNGGKPPRHAKKEMGCLALAGAQDGNRGAAEGTVKLLEDKVRFVDCRIQPNLGHAFPRELVPYWQYVMEVMEGRFTPGDQRSYEWASDLGTARKRMADEKLGGFAYVWSSEADEKETELTRAYQNEALFDRITGFFGRQLVAVKLEKGEAADLIEEARIKATPAIVVFKRGGAKVAKVLTGKLKPRKLASALRSVARVRKLPD